jgi:hypothetical protein
MVTKKAPSGAFLLNIHITLIDVSVNINPIKRSKT